VHGHGGYVIIFIGVKLCQRRNKYFFVYICLGNIIKTKISYSIKKMESEHITYQLDEDSNKEEFNYDSFLHDFEKMQNHDDEIFVTMKDYDLNYSVKQLLLICEYYVISKSSIRTNKMKKQDIIEQIILFEHDPNNREVVERRKRMWFYINELKEDKFMKKYIIMPSG